MHIVTEGLLTYHRLDTYFSKSIHRYYSVMSHIICYKP